MIYEIRTYTLRAGTTAEVEARFGEAYPVREQHSPLAGFFHTEIGPLNEVVHIWPYADIEERNRIRAAAAQEDAWPPPIAEFILDQRVDVVVPFPFAPAWTPGVDGPIYELRQYSFRAGTLPAIMRSWEERLAERLKLSPLALLGSVEFGGTVNSFVHLWPYPSLDRRNEVRRAAVEAGIWPPEGGRERYLLQSSKILLPSAFSPAQ